MGKGVVNKIYKGKLVERFFFARELGERRETLSRTFSS